MEALRRRGFDGTITWIGAEPHRPYDRPPLSKQILRGDWEPERATLKATYETLDVEFRFGTRATALEVRSRRVQLSDGSSVMYDRLVIATGATARALPGAESLPGVHRLRTLEDAIAIRRALVEKPRVAIVGAGFIGLEVAASCRALGIDVTVVESAPVPLANAIGETMGTAIAELHRARGVQLVTGVGVERVLGDGRARGLHLTDGRAVSADLIIVGIGVVPNTDWLEGSGLVVSNGVVCDEYGRTSVPGVVACGDVARWRNPLFEESFRVEHWTNAVEQANSAVAALFDDTSELVPIVPYFWSDQYDAKIQFAGRIAPGDELRIEEGSVAAKNLVATYGRQGRLRGVLTVNKPAALVRFRRAIAAGAAF